MRVSIDQGFDVEYTRVEGSMVNRSIQRLLQISLNPLVVFHGLGEDNQKADSVAARCALEYLRVLLKSKLDEQFKAWTWKHANAGRFTT